MRVTEVAARGESRAANDLIWLHGASVGDMRALAPLVAALEEACPDTTLYITATTRDGRRMARRLFPHLDVGKPPLAPGAPARAIRAIGPRLIVLEYLELWPRWVAAAHRARVPVAVVDGRVTGRSLRIRPLLRRAAHQIDLFCARSEADAANAQRLGVQAERIRICGNGKYDGIPRDPPSPDDALRTAVGSVDVVVGSLAPAEERAALSALARSGLRALIAPRYPRRTPGLLRRARRLGIEASKRSLGSNSDATWVILDTLGELAAAYALAPTAVVGGTFCRREGQTLLEPAAHGCAVVHGPRIANVEIEARALAGRGGWPVDDWTMAFAMVRRLRATAGPDPREAIGHLLGATRRNLDALLTIPEPE